MSLRKYVNNIDVLAADYKVERLVVPSNPRLHTGLAAVICITPKIDKWKVVYYGNWSKLKHKKAPSIICEKYLRKTDGMRMIATEFSRDKTRFAVTLSSDVRAGLDTESKILLEPFWKGEISTVQVTIRAILVYSYKEEKQKWFLELSFEKNEYKEQLIVPSRKNISTQVNKWVRNLTKLQAEKHVRTVNENIYQFFTGVRKKTELIVGLENKELKTFLIIAHDLQKKGYNVTGSRTLFGSFLGILSYINKYEQPQNLFSAIDGYFYDNFTSDLPNLFPTLKF